jgi:hypothetical protein
MGSTNYPPEAIELPRRKKNAANRGNKSMPRRGHIADVKAKPGRDLDYLTALLRREGESADGDPR